MNAKKTTYILTALLIAAIAGLLIWATAAENSDTVTPPPASGSGAESRPSVESGASSDSLPPDASSRPDVSETPSETSEDAEEAYAQRVGKSYRIDMTPYLAYVTSSDEEYLRLVNQTHLLPSDYVPEDLVTVEPAYSNGGKLKSEVNDAFCGLVEAMWAETGLHLVNASPYRSYQTQKNLYARYRTQYSEATTDRFSARAGYSEHQTGLALDVIAPGGTLNGFKNTQQFVWMRDNAHRFGFILRYGDGMEYITGYKFEPWHYRYVGVEAATFIYENDLTFEEYYAYYVKK